MENVKIVVNMVIKLMSARRNQNFKVNVTNVRDKVTRHPNVDLNHSIQLNNLIRKYLDGTTMLGVDVIIVENMDTLA